MSHSVSYGIKSSFFKFKVALTMVAVALTPPKFNHFLLEHFGNSENLKKIHSQLNELHCSLTYRQTGGQTPMIT